MKIRNLTIKLAVLALAIMLLLSIPLVFSANAQEIPPAFRWHVQSVFSEDFGTAVGNFPASPGNLTGGFLGNFDGGTGIDHGVVSGVIPLNHYYSAHFDAIGLGIYDEFNQATDIPMHPHGIDHSFASDNPNVLMINTNRMTTAFGYSTQEFTLEPNSFYRFSAYVRTGGFADNQGAAVTLTGLPNPVGIWNIDTVSNIPRRNGTNLPALNVQNRFGFEQFRIYLATGLHSETVALNLSVGDSITGRHFPSNGFAFFDAVRVDRLSPTAFYDDTLGRFTSNTTFWTSEQVRQEQNEQFYELYHRAGLQGGALRFNNAALFNMNPGNYLRSVSRVYERVYDEFDIFLYDRFLRYDNTGTNLGHFYGETRHGARVNGWRVYEPEDPNIGTGQPVWGIFNAGAPFIGDYAFGITEHPMTSTGISTTRRDNSILVLSSHAGGTNFNDIDAGIISEPFLIRAGTFYQLSFWFNTQHLDGTATAVISGQSTIAQDGHRLIPVPVGGLVTDATNYARYGWQRRDFHIQGSLIEDVELNLEFWLGRGELASGVLMIDEIMLTRIDYDTFNEEGAHGTQVFIDATPMTGGEITNGMFGSIIRETDELTGRTLPISFPARLSNWEFINTYTANTLGHSNELIPYEDIIHGAIPTHPALFYPARDDDRTIPMINRPTPGFNQHRYINRNLLLMYSPADTMTAFGYRSAAFNVSDGERSRVIINMNVNAGGAGANLVLRSGNRILSTIMNIRHTGGAFRDFAFYIEGGHGTDNISLEIWLGMTDTGANLTRLANGFIVVNSVMIESEPPEFAQRYYHFNSMLGYFNPPSNFAVVSADAFRFNAFDRFGTSPIREAFGFQLLEHTDSAIQGGIIAGITQEQNQIPRTVVEAMHRLDNASLTSVFLRNINPGHSQMNSLHSFNLMPHNWYRIEFDMFVDLHGIDRIFNYDADNPHPHMTRNELLLEQARVRAMRGVELRLGPHSFTHDIRNSYGDVPITMFEGELLDENYEPSVIRDSNNNIIEVLSRKIKVYRSEFRTFSFYFATGDDVESLNWSVLVGGFESAQVAGFAVINAVRVVEIGQGDFNTRYELQYDEYGELSDEASRFVSMVNLSSVPREDITDPDDDYTGSGTGNGGLFENLGFMIAAILFALAILIVLVTVAGKKIMAARNAKRPPSSKRPDKVPTYDRRRAIDAEDVVVVDDNIDSFDDDGQFVEETVIEDTIVVESDEFDDDAQTVREEVKKERKEFDSEFDD